MPSKSRNSCGVAFDGEDGGLGGIVDVAAGRTCGLVSSTSVETLTVLLLSDSTSSGICGGMDVDSEGGC